MNTDLEMNVRDVVIDLDWFVLGSLRLIKRIAYYDIDSGRHMSYTVSFPAAFCKYTKNLERHTKYSHGIPWYAPGFFDLKDLPQFLLTLKWVIGARHIRFYAKGEQKCKILERQGVHACNLDDLGCPKFERLTDREKTTRNKAIVFGQWVESQHLAPPCSNKTVSDKL